MRIDKIVIYFPEETVEYESTVKMAMLLDKYNRPILIVPYHPYLYSLDVPIVDYTLGQPKPILRINYVRNLTKVTPFYENEPMKKFVSKIKLKK